MDITSDVWNQLIGASPAWITAIVCIVLGYVIRPLPFVSNRLIPTICLLIGGIAYSLLVPIGDIDPGTSHPEVRRFLIGMLIGFISWTLHKAFLKPVEARFPAISEFLEGSDSPDKTPQTTQPVNKS